MTALAAIREYCAASMAWAEACVNRAEPERLGELEVREQRAWDALPETCKKALKAPEVTT